MIIDTLKYTKTQNTCIQSGLENEIDNESEMNNLNDERELEKAKLLRNLEKVKSSGKSLDGRQLLEKKFCTDVVKFSFKKCIKTMSLEDKCYKNVNYAILAKLFLERGLGFFEMTSSSDDYLLLLAEMICQFESAFEKNLKVNVETQTDSSEKDEEEEAEEEENIESPRKRSRIE